ncbi:phosphate ABC transporter substrate-binding protein PstS [Lysobacter fragariae]
MKFPVRLACFGFVLALAACSQGNAPGNQDAASTGAAAAEITGAGASFVYPLLSKWSADYHQATGAKVNYQSIGSGGGIAQIKAGTVDFGSSDKPLPPEELVSAGLGQFPSAIGGVVPVVHVEGIDAGKLRLTGPLLADIYLGKVAMWNDAAIAAVNPGIALPATKISVVHRSDGSGTTFNLANYLSKVSPAWKATVGEGTTVNWPSGIGGKGNEGVAAYVQQIQGAIGYVELAYALQNKMSYTALQNAAGQFVLPSAQTFSAAAESADWKNARDFFLVMTNAPGENAWPITATNFILMYKKPRDAKRNADALAFFKWSFEHGQAQAQSLDYVPLPPDLVAQVEQYWAQEFK